MRVQTRTPALSLLLTLIAFVLVLGPCFAERDARKTESESYELRKGGKGARGGSGGSSPGPSGVKSGTSNTGRTYYSRPKTYSSSGPNGFTSTPTRYTNRPAMRPYYLIFLLGAGGLASGRSHHRQCEEGTFRFGSSCRPCSDQTCPIGQYRIECSPYNDAHCTSCTNKPENDITQYTTPGNNNDCAYEECDGACPRLAATNEAVVGIDVIVPVSESEFPSMEEGYRSGIAEVGQVPGTSIIFAEKVERTQSVDRGVEHAETGPAQAQAQAQAQRRLLDELNATAENSTVDDVNLTAIDAWSCSSEIPEHGKYLQISVEIVTTEDKVDALWDRLTAFAVANEMAERCLPPPLLSYQDEPPTAAAATAAAPMASPLPLLLAALVAPLMLSGLHR